ncbi:ISAs1 family transposase [Azovibrio restrictus]|uniref:ISAs1 family transposase n=1 Tax=Azovibrio restrictus TaxID=146938 RepID=UPI0034E986BC
MTPEALALAVRAHWAVENKLHWMLDVNFSEDACTVKKDNAPEILSLIRRVVLNMLALDQTQPAFTRRNSANARNENSPTSTSPSSSASNLYDVRVQRPWCCTTPITAPVRSQKRYPVSL